MKYLIFLTLFSVNVLASEKNLVYKIMGKDKHSLQDSKNGISLDLVTKNFEKNFKFVSVHFRDDKFELRLIYGNKKALKGIKTKDFKYEDGAIFYKVAYQTEKDPSFQASLRPQRQPLVRQIMLRDSKRFKESNGWGYAVFTEDAKTLPGDPDKTTATCYACHKIVSERNDVFTRPVETILPNSKIESSHFPMAPTQKELTITKDLFKFKVGLRSELPSDILANLPKDEKINIMYGDILKYDFPGYMTEINSFLAKETIQNGLPSIAYKKFNDQMIFGYTLIDKTDKSCKPSEHLIRFGIGSSTDFQVRTHLKQIKKCMPKKQ